MIVVTFFYRNNDLECEAVRNNLFQIAKDIPHQLVEIDIDTDPSLNQAYGSLVPVIKVGPYILRRTFTVQELRVAMSAAMDRSNQLIRLGDDHYQKKIRRGHSLSKADSITYWLSHHYMALITVFVAIYLGLPFLAPVLMKFKVNTPAKIIYAIYSPVCHQLAFRSWFLFGEQPFYPLDLAHIPNELSYEQIANISTIDLNEARGFVGNDVVGFKVALCERDVAIYGSILFFCIFFSLIRKWIKKPPLFLWICIGILPIAIDGGSQLVGLASADPPSWWPIRESTPLLRSITGILFGIMTAWYLFPVIEESMSEVRLWFVQKNKIVSELQSSGLKE